jgi:uncharacterized protein (UPF0262 family)
VPTVRARLIDVTLDQETLAHPRPEFEHDRQVAISDLLTDNSFVLVGDNGGPYRLRIGIEEGRLLFDVSGGKEHPLKRVRLPLKPFRRVIKDYIELAVVHYDALPRMTPSRIEALDMGRRGLHNEGADLLREALARRIEVDRDTARRLFTLICALHFRS